MAHDQHLPHTHRSPLESLKKRSLYIFSVLLALSVGYLTYSGVSSTPTGAVVFSSGSLVDDAQGFTVSAQLAPPLPEIELTDATLTLELTGTGKLSLNGLDFEGVGERTLVLTGYTGTLSTSVNNGVSLKGKATSAILDTMSIRKGNSLVVDAQDVPFTRIRMVEVTLDSIALVSTGTINVAEKGSFQVYDEPIELKPFTGSLDIDSKGLTLDGTIDTFRIEGARKISVE